MFENLPARLGPLWKRGLRGVLQFPGAFRNSLNPATELDARNVEAQLELVRANVRRLDYAFPITAAMLVSLHSSRGSISGTLLMFVIVAAAAAINEIFLLPGRSEDRDLISRAKEDSRTISFAIFSLMMAWGTFAFSLWLPGGHLLTMLVLACTLAASSGMFAAHTGSAVASIMTLSTFTLVLEFVNGYSKHLRLFQLFLIYVAMIAVQACMNHARFNKAWRLEQDRERLIENLREAKIESDRAHKQAVAASRAKSEFLANMSHELRTPLNAIIGFSDIIRTRAFGDSDKYPEYGGFIHQSGHHLLALIGDILELAKIEAGRKILQQEPTDVMSLVIDETRLIEERAAEKRIKVVPILPRSLPLLNADPHAVRQILANLLSNALKFTPPDGKIEVSVALNTAREVELSVSDSGIGIAPEDQPFLFDRFGQGRPEITKAERGSGLGLPIVKGLIDMHDGRVELESELGYGTRIGIIFPAKSTIESSVLRVA